MGGHSFGSKLGPGEVSELGPGGAMVQNSVQVESGRTTDFSGSCKSFPRRVLMEEFPKKSASRSDVHESSISRRAML
jgi:hypothetical protein